MKPSDQRRRGGEARTPSCCHVSFKAPALLATYATNSDMSSSVSRRNEVIATKLGLGEMSNFVSAFPKVSLGQVCGYVVFCLQHVAIKVSSRHTVDST
jgi:hypothetical protein